MAKSDDLDELQRQYAALGFAQASMTVAATPPSGDLDELQRQYAALGFSASQSVQQTPVGDSFGGTADHAGSSSRGPRGAQEADCKRAISFDEMQQQYADLFRPAALDMEADCGHYSPLRTPDSSSASTGVATRCAGGIDEFAMYQRFRLHMVKMFGSLASALFELGAEPDTGTLARQDFVEVLCATLHLFSRSEANSLFSHATNADVMDGDVGGVATSRDFGINEDEWRTVVSAKQQSGSERRAAMPFQSGPSGASMGIFHRNVTLEQVLRPNGSTKGISPNSSKGFATDPPTRATTATSGGGRPQAPVRTPPRQQRPLRRILLGSGQRVWPWQLPQKPYAPSVMAGQAFLEQARNELPKAAARRSRACEFTFSSIIQGSLFARSRHSELGHIDRSSECKLDEAAGHLLASVPCRRSEMEPKACIKQVSAWWAYESPAPPPKLPTVLPPAQRAAVLALRSPESAAKK